MADKIQVHVSQSFAAAPAEVYKAWLDPDTVRGWLGNALKSMGLSGQIAQVKTDPESAANSCGRTSVTGLKRGFGVAFSS